MGNYIGRTESDLALNVFQNVYEHITPDGVLASFTMIQDVPGALSGNIEVVKNNVLLEPDAAYHINPANWYQIVFTSVPLITDVIYVIHRGATVNYAQPAAGSVGATELSDNIKNFVNDTFSGTGAQVNYTLSSSGTNNSVLVTVGGIVQNAPTNYSISGTALTFTSAPPNLSIIKALSLGYPAPVTKNPLPSNSLFTNPRINGTAASGASGELIMGSSTQTTIGANGSATALTANPRGYLVAYLGTTKIVIPFYNG